jgi:hypothetical protein
MAVRVILRRNYTRADVEWRMDQLALQYQQTHDKKIIRKVLALGRVLRKMGNRSRELKIVQ